VKRGERWRGEGHRTEDVVVRGLEIAVGGGVVGVSNGRDLEVVVGIAEADGGAFCGGHGPLSLMANDMMWCPAVRVMGLGEG
jgi:hypothetical protein